jgi:hypothetical protein
MSLLFLVCPHVFRKTPYLPALKSFEILFDILI